MHSRDRCTDGTMIAASLLLVAMPGAPSSFLFLVAMPFAPSSVLAPRSNDRCYGEIPTSVLGWRCRLVEGEDRVVRSLGSRHGSSGNGTFRPDCLSSHWEACMYVSPGTSKGGPSHFSSAKVCLGAGSWHSPHVLIRMLLHPSEARGPTPG